MMSPDGNRNDKYTYTLWWLALNLHFFPKLFLLLLTFCKDKELFMSIIWHIPLWLGAKHPLNLSRIPFWLKH